VSSDQRNSESNSTNDVNPTEENEAKPTDSDADPERDTDYTYNDSDSQDTDHYETANAVDYDSSQGVNDNNNSPDGANITNIMKVIKRPVEKTFLIDTLQKAMTLAVLPLLSPDLPTEGLDFVVEDGILILFFYLPDSFSFFFFWSLVLYDPNRQNYDQSVVT
jgi:hypothetical protein